VLFQKLRPLVIIAGFLLVSAALYWCRSLLIPLALAVLITFLLNPLVGWLERRGLPRALSIGAIVLFASAAVGGAATWGEHSRTAGTPARCA
jgi:predicted PurR-regulated permease PerM